MTNQWKKLDLRVLTIDAPDIETRLEIREKPDHTAELTINSNALPTYPGKEPVRMKDFTKEFPSVNAAMMWGNIILADARDLKEYNKRSKSRSAAAKLLEVN